MQNAQKNRLDKDFGLTCNKETTRTVKTAFMLRPGP